jgi:hypothetical protein
LSLHYDITIIDRSGHSENLKHTVVVLLLRCGAEQEILPQHLITNERVLLLCPAKFKHENRLDAISPNVSLLLLIALFAAFFRSFLETLSATHKSLKQE